MRKKALDLQKLNPNWKLASDHGKSQQPGLEPKETGRLNSLLLCPCCLNVIQKQPVSLCQNSKELYFLGYGFPLFYNTLQFCLISVFILILIESGILLEMSIQDNDCAQYLQTHSERVLAAADKIPYRCQNGLILIARVYGQVSIIELLTRIFSFVAQLALLIYFRDTQRKQAAYHVERNIRITDFSIIFKNLPKMAGIKKKITDFLTNQFEGIQPQIQNILLIPVIDEYYDKQKQKQKMINRKRTLLGQKEVNPQLIEKIDHEIEHINDQIINVCRQIEQKSDKDQLYAQKAIVILKSELQKVEVIERFSKISKSTLSEYFVWMGDEVTLKQAPDPKQIIWENVNFPKNQRWVKIVIGWILTVFFLGAVTAVFYAVIRAKGEILDINLHDDDGYTPQQFQEATAIVIIAILVIQFFNKFLMKIILHKIADLEMPQTTSQLQFSYALKYTLGMFFTTAVMTLAVEAIQFENYSGQYGVVEEETIMFFFNSFFVPLLWITHPQYYIRKLMRWKYKNSQNFTQKQANQLMEEFPYDIGKRYAEIIETMWFTFLYSSLIPLGAMLSFCGFCIYYWVDKYNLLRRSSISGRIQSKLPLSAIKLMQITILWKPIGQFLFDRQIRNITYPSTIVMMCVGVVYLFIPWDRVLNFVFEQKFNIKTVSYEDVKYQFTEIYQTVDPIRRQLTIHKFMKDRNLKTRKNNLEFREYQMEAASGLAPSHVEINLITSSNQISSLDYRGNQSKNNLVM